jgi:drug/metabolite transporter (DMT)-like permease
MVRNVGPALALAAAVLFGLSTPAAKWLVGVADPWLLAGLLYLGSGFGLGAVRLAAWLRGRPLFGLTATELPWLAGAVLSGGVIGPVLLMLALADGSAAQAALLLNLEGVFTALIAWGVAREHVDARIATGMAAIAAGAAVLSWASTGVAIDRSAALVAGACLAWAIDNNLTRRVASAGAVEIAALKGGVAGAINIALATLHGATIPPVPVVIGAGVIGLLGYGTSLVFFVLALRHLGAARTGAYFSTAPFVGAAASVVAFGEAVSGGLLAGGALMAVGVWLHLSERHDHHHAHEPMAHSHQHRHDVHHQHDHPPGRSAGESHVHWHVHEHLAHRHPHYPDLHHRHRH